MPHLFMRRNKAMFVDYYLNMKYKETEDGEYYKFYPDDEIKENLSHQISRFGYYDVFRYR